MHLAKSMVASLWGRRRTVAVIAVLLVAAAPLEAQLIDDMSVAQGPIFRTAPADLGTPTSNSVAAGIGAERDAEVTMDGAVFGGALLVYEVGSGFMELDNSGAWGTLEVQWDGADGSSVLNPVGLGGVDLTGGGAFDAMNLNLTIVLTGGSPGVNVDFLVTVYTNAGQSSTFPFSRNSEVTNQNVTIPFASFAGTADFTNVGAITLRVQSFTYNYDVRISMVEVTSTQAVPTMHPALLVILATLLGAFGWLQVRRRRA